MRSLSLDASVSQAKSERYFSPAQAASLLDIKLPTIRKWMLCRKIAFVKVGGRLTRIPASEITRLTSNVVPALEGVRNA